MGDVRSIVYLDLNFILCCPITFWRYLDPFLQTETDKVNVKKEDKSRKGKISWRTCYNKLSSKGQLKGNQLRKRRLRMMDLRDLPFPL